MACKQKRRMYLLREGEMLPIIMTLPTGSLAEFTKYVTRLVTRGMKANHVVTKFSLKRAQNSTGINYSQVICSVDRHLSRRKEEHRIHDRAGQADRGQGFRRRDRDCSGIRIKQP